jgi:hypothetical protein
VRLGQGAPRARSECARRANRTVADGRSADRQGATMVRFIFALVVAAVAVTGCATPLETTSLHLSAGDGKWKPAGGSDRRGRTLAEFVPPDESIDNWSRLLTIQFIEQKGVSPGVVMDQLRTAMQVRCPDSPWQVIQQDSTSVLYEWSIAHCGSNPDEHEIARLLKGNDGIQRVAFTQKGLELASAEREQWVKILSDAYVVKDGVRVVVAP